MPQKDLNSFWGMVADLYRGTSFSVFFCTVGGMVLGALLTVGAVIFWLTAMASLAVPRPTPGMANGSQTVQTVPVRPGAGRVVFALVIPGVLGGGMVGCLFGVILDFMVNLLRGPQVKMRRGKKWVPERDAVRRPQSRPAKHIPQDLGSHWKRDDNDNDNDKFRPEL